MEMEGEIQRFINVWVTAVVSLCYCYFIPRRLPKGFIRLLSLLPVVSLFTLLPLSLSSVHLCGPTAFYLTWLANFKLLLLSFDLGPLSPPHHLPLLHFLSVAALPLIITPTVPPPPHRPYSINPSLNLPGKSLLLAGKLLAFDAILRTYTYRRYLHSYVIIGLYCCHVYLGVELVLGLSAGLARALTGLETEAQFREPYRATSLQDFWGRRWNLAVPSVLHAAVYGPVRRAARAAMGPLWATAVGSVAAFAVSGLMHELIFFHLAGAPPTWEVTCFFVLHGVCTAAEVVVKKKVAAASGGAWRLPGVVSGPLALGFVAVTGAWLFLPQMTRNGVDLKAIEEYYFVSDFVKHKLFSSI